MCMENPANSLVAMQSRFVWLVQLLEKHGIPAPCLNDIYLFEGLFEKNDLHKIIIAYRF